MKALLLLLGLCVAFSNAAIQCLDPNGNTVDWFFMLKLPNVVGDFKGYTYLYVDAVNSTTMIGDLSTASNNALANTVTQIGLYGGNADASSVGYVLWNDQVYESVSGKAIDHEKDSSGVYYAHSKATIAFDAETGFWLAHSAPGFPFSHNICPSSWTFPEAQSIYAQHFFCVSLTTSTLDTISQSLLNYYSYIYDSNIPNSISGISNIANFASGKYTTGASSWKFQSIGGVNFVAFGKHGDTHSDIFEDYIAPGLGSGLFVESWCCGSFGDCCQQSYCQGAPIVDPSDPQKSKSTYDWNSITIEKFSFASNLYYETKNNHAKFALSQSFGYVCPSDNNRADTQRNRGGGSICFQNQPLYDLLYNHITGFNTTC
uniref:Uncharacterized protein n=1 Tax=Arcella intermedia TaxID=1963864 RepID=A0A6B2L7A3_9EUKA